MALPTDELYKINIKFPGDIEYIPSIRKFIAEVLTVDKFSPKFTFRSEIIVDEICNNAVTHGSKDNDANVELTCNVFPEHVEFEVKDTGGDSRDVERLKEVVGKKTPPKLSKEHEGGGLGLDIVRMLAENVDLQIDDNNLTSIRILKHREKK